MQLGQLAVAGGFGLLGAVLIVNTSSMGAVAHIEYGPGLFPSIVGWGMIGLSCLAAFDALRTPRETPATAAAELDDAPPAEPLTPQSLILFTAFLVAPIFYVFVAPVLGFLLTMPVIVGGLAFLASGRPWRALLLGIGLTIFLHIVFYDLLRVTLPWGILTPYAGILTWK